MKKFEDALKDIDCIVRKDLEKVVDNDKVFNAQKYINDLLMKELEGFEDLSVHQLYEALDLVERSIYDILQKKHIHEKFEDVLKDNFLYTKNTLSSYDILILLEEINQPISKVLELIDHDELKIFDTPEKLFFSLLSFNFNDNPIFKTDDLYNFKLSHIPNDEIQESDSIGSLIIYELSRRGQIIHLEDNKLAYFQK